MLVLCATGAQQSAFAKDLLFFSIGSGELGGAYYAIARDTCREVNRTNHAKFRCSPEVTRGSLYNLDALARGDLDFAIVQSDWQYHAYQGTSFFAKSKPMINLRSVLTLFVEPVIILARRELKIENIRDLVGRRVDIGHPSSGRNATFKIIMNAFGLTQDDFSGVFELRGEGALSALCSGIIDATILAEGHPSVRVERALEDCDSEIVGIEGQEVEKLVRDKPYYIEAVIPAAIYPNLTEDVKSLGALATLVTTDKVHPDAVRTLLATVLKRRRVLEASNPVLRRLPCSVMQGAGLSAPRDAVAKEIFSKPCKE